MKKKPNLEESSESSAAFGNFSKKGLQTFPSFREISSFESLDFSFNPISSLRTLPVLPLLENLNMDGTNLESFAHSQKQPSLKVLNLKNTPLSFYPGIKVMSLVAFGFWLTEVNGMKITEEEIEIAQKISPRLRPLLLNGWNLTSTDPPRVVHCQTHECGTLDDIAKDSEKKMIDYDSSLNNDLIPEKQKSNSPKKYHLVKKKREKSDSSYSDSDDISSSDTSSQTSESDQQNKEVFSITSENGIKVKNSQSEVEVIQMKKDPDPSAYAPVERSPPKITKNVRKGKKVVKKKSSKRVKKTQKQKEPSSSSSSSSDNEESASAPNEKNAFFPNVNINYNNDEDEDNDTNLISGSFKAIDNSDSEADTRSPVFMRQDIYSPLFQHKTNFAPLLAPQNYDLTPKFNDNNEDLNEEKENNENNKNSQPLLLPKQQEKLFISSENQQKKKKSKKTLKKQKAAPVEDLNEKQNNEDKQLPNKKLTSKKKIIKRYKNKPKEKLAMTSIVSTFIIRDDSSIMSKPDSDIITLHIERVFSLQLPLRDRKIKNITPEYLIEENGIESTKLLNLNTPTNNSISNQNNKITEKKKEIQSKLVINDNSSVMQQSEAISVALSDDNEEDEEESSSEETTSQEFSSSENGEEDEPLILLQPVSPKRQQKTKISPKQQIIISENRDKQSGKKETSSEEPAAISGSPPPESDGKSDESSTHSDSENDIQNKIDLIQSPRLNANAKQNYDESTDESSTRSNEDEVIPKVQYKYQSKKPSSDDDKTNSTTSSSKQDSEKDATHDSKTIYSDGDKKRSDSEEEEEEEKSEPILQTPTNKLQSNKKDLPLPQFKQPKDEAKVSPKMKTPSPSVVIQAPPLAVPDPLIDQTPEDDVDEKKNNNKREHISKLYQPKVISSQKVNKTKIAQNYEDERPNTVDDIQAMKKSIETKKKHHHRHHHHHHHKNDDTTNTNSPTHQASYTLDPQQRRERATNIIEEFLKNRAKERENENEKLAIPVPLEKPRAHGKPVYSVDDSSMSLLKKKKKNRSIIETPKRTELPKNGLFDSPFLPPAKMPQKFENSIDVFRDNDKKENIFANTSKGKQINKYNHRTSKRKDSLMLIESKRRSHHRKSKTKEDTYSSSSTSDSSYSSNSYSSYDTNNNESDNDTKRVHVGRKAPPLKGENLYGTLDGTPVIKGSLFANLSIDDKSPPKEKVRKHRRKGQTAEGTQFRRNDSPMPIKTDNKQKIPKYKQKRPVNVKTYF